MKIPKLTEGYLRYSLYLLFHMEEISSFDWLGPEYVAAFLNEYNLDVRRGIIDALKWVSRHPEADLTDVLPNLPLANDRLHVFANKIYILANCDAGQN